MALIKCVECEREISDAAKSCPGCGYPSKSHRPLSTPVAVTQAAPGPEPTASSSRTQLLTLALVSLLVIVGLKVVEDEPKANRAPRKSPRQDHQDANRSLLDELVMEASSEPSTYSDNNHVPALGEARFGTVEIPDWSAVLIDEDIHDSAIKTQIVQRIRLIGKPTAAELRNYLTSRSLVIARRPGFKHRKHPDAIFLYVYDTYAKARAGGNFWVGMSHQLPGEKRPTVSVDEQKLGAID